MAKRRKRKQKRPTIASKFGLSQKKYENLRDESAKARRRIKDFAKRTDSSDYFTPDANDYLLSNLLERISNGEKVSSVLNEVKSLTHRNIVSGNPLGVKTLNGYKLSARDTKKVFDAVSKANENIRKARKDFESVSDILPNEFDAKEFVETIGSKESLELHLKGLELFTEENLVPTAVNEYGEVGTVAEYQYYRQILERENERRAKLREMTDPKKVQGNIVQQDEYDKRNIDIDKIQGVDELRKRADTWDDARRIQRANMYLDVYRENLELTEAVFRTNNLMNDDIAEKFKFIYNVIAKTRGNEDAITYLSNRMDKIQISIVSGGVIMSGEAFYEIYDQWSEFSEMKW